MASIVKAPIVVGAEVETAVKPDCAGELPKSTESRAAPKDELRKQADSAAKDNIFFIAWIQTGSAPVELKCEPGAD